MSRIGDGDRGSTAKGGASPAASTCMFCRIISGDERSFTVYHGDSVTAFLDKYPASPGHLLVVPNAHYTDYLEASDDVLCDLAAMTRIAGKAERKALSADGVRVISNVGRSAGQMIFHLHIHIIPTWEGEVPFSWFTHRSEQPESEYREIAASLSASIKEIIAYEAEERRRADHG